MLKRQATDELIPFSKRSRLTTDVISPCSIASNEFQSHINRKRQRFGSSEFEINFEVRRLKKELNSTQTALNTECQKSGRLESENTLLRKGLESLSKRAGNCKCEDLSRQVCSQQETIQFLKDITFSLRKQIESLQSGGSSTLWQGNTFGGDGHVF